MGEFNPVGMVGEVEITGEGSHRITKNAVTYAFRNQVINLLIGETGALPEYIAVGVLAGKMQGTATSATASTLSDSGKNWVTDAFIGYTVQIVAGNGSGQKRAITSNTATQLTVSPDWTTTPNTTSEYRIVESVDIRTWTELPLEVHRKAIEGKRALSDAQSLLGVFRKGEGAGDLTHLLLIDQPALTAVINECDNLSDWDAVGTGQAMSVDSAEYRSVSASLRVDISSSSSGTITYQHKMLQVDASAVTDTAALTFWLYIPNISKLSSALTCELASSATADTSEWQWSIPITDLVTGWNFVKLNLTSSTKTGSPDLADIRRFKLMIPYTTNTNGLAFRLDRIWLYKSQGSPLAIAELSPTYAKASNGNLNIRWNVQLQFTLRKNTMLWNAQDSSAVVADVSRTLTESGVAGSYAAVTSHPWKWPKMYDPGNDGYVTVGNTSLSTKQGTIALWFQFGSSMGSADVVFDWRYDASNYMRLARISSTQWRFSITKAGVISNATITDNLSSGAYRFIVCTWNATTVGMSSTAPGGGSANGLTTSSISASDLLESLPVDATLGGGSTLQSPDLCKIGPVTFWNTALSQAEINTLYLLARPMLYKEL